MYISKEYIDGRDVCLQISICSKCKLENNTCDGEKFIFLINYTKDKTVICFKNGIHKFEILETVNDSFTIKDVKNWLDKNKITEDTNKLCKG